MEEALRKYYGSNYNKYLRTYRESVTKAKENLLKEYPKATLGRFEFQPEIDKEGNLTKMGIWFINSDTVQTNIDSSTFKHDKSMWIYLHNFKGVRHHDPVIKNGFPIIWLANATDIAPLPKGKAHKHYEFGSTTKVHDIWYDGFPSDDVLNYPINNFRVYVNSKDYFMSKLPELKISHPGKPFNWDDTNSYFMTIFATYAATYCCGISMQHLAPSDEVYPMITSIARYHVYFTVRRLLKRMEGNDSMHAISTEFRAGNLYREIEKLPWTFSYESHSGGVSNVRVVRTGYQNHYRRYVPKSSNGLTRVGLKRLNQSIEAYIYSILGAQAKTRVSIVNHGGGSLESQQEFRKLTEDAITNYSVSTWILNMSRSIADTHVTQDLALSPKSWLVPSKMIILKKAIEGYNNLLKTATESMKFGVNDINYHKVRHITPRKVHADVSQHLESLDGPAPAVTTAKHDLEELGGPQHTPATTPKHDKPTVATAKHDLEELPVLGTSTVRSSVESDNQSNAGAVLALAAVGGYMASKYIYPIL